MVFPTGPELAVAYLVVALSGSPRFKRSKRWVKAVEHLFGPVLFSPNSVDTLGVLTVGVKQLMLRSLKRTGACG